MVVDCFTKKVQIWPLTTKSSENVGDWLHRHFLLHFSKPHWVCEDANKEFEGICA